MIKRETRKEAAGAALLGLVLAGAAQPVAGVELEPPAPADPIELFLAAETPPRRAAVAGAAQDAPREAGGQGGDVAASGTPGGGAGSVVLVRKPGSGRSGAGGAPERREVEIRLKPADDSITRKSDGGLVLAGLPGFSLVGFYGYGGFEKGGGYHFTGTGYMGVDGISRIIPASLLLAGFTAFAGGGARALCGLSRGALARCGEWPWRARQPRLGRRGGSPQRAADSRGNRPPD